MLENIFTSEENEKEYPTSLTEVVYDCSTTCTILDGKSENNNHSSHQQLPLQVTKQDIAIPLIFEHQYL